MLQMSVQFKFTRVVTCDWTSSWNNTVPLYFCLSIISSSFLIHCHATSCMTHMSLCDCSHSMLTFVGPISPDSHTEWTDDLHSRPCCNLSIARQVLCHFSCFYLYHSILYHTTALVSHPTCPVTGQPVTSHCATQLVSQGLVAISLQMGLGLDFLDIQFVSKLPVLSAQRIEKFFPRAQT